MEPPILDDLAQEWVPVPLMLGCNDDDLLLPSLPFFPFLSVSQFFVWFFAVVFSCHIMMANINIFYWNFM